MSHPWPEEYIPDPSKRYHSSVPSLETAATGITVTADDWHENSRAEDDVSPPHHFPPSSSPSASSFRRATLTINSSLRSTSFLDPAVSHRHIPSLTTNASGLAESTISTFTTDSIGLPAFPAPPPDLPTPSPRRTEFDIPAIPAGSSPLPTPTRLNFGNTTPTRNRFSGTNHSSNSSHGGGGGTFRFGTPPPPSLYINKSDPGSPVPTPRSARFDFNTADGPPHPSSTSNLVLRPPPSPLRSSHSVPSMHGREEQASHELPPFDAPLIPKHYDWNDGMSAVSVDSTEEKLLSTDFISSLLTSTSAKAPGSRQTSGDKRQQERSALSRKSGEDFSGAYQGVRSSSPADFLDHEGSSPRDSLVASQASGGLTQVSGASGISEMQQATLQTTIVRTASRVWGARADGSFGKHVVGTAPATFRNVSAMSTHRNESTVQADAASQVASLVSPSLLPSYNVRRSTMSSPPPKHTFDAPDDIAGDDDMYAALSGQRRQPSRPPLTATSPPYPSLNRYDIASPRTGSPFSAHPLLSSSNNQSGENNDHLNAEGGSQLNSQANSLNGQIPSSWQSTNGKKERRSSMQTTRTSRTTKSFASSIVSRFTPSFIDMASGNSDLAPSSSSSPGRYDHNKRSWFSKRSLPPVPGPPSAAEVTAADKRYRAKLERERHWFKAGTGSVVTEDEKAVRIAASPTGEEHALQGRYKDDVAPRKSDVAWASEDGDQMMYQVRRGYGGEGDQYSTAAEVGTVIPGGTLHIGNHPTTASRMQYTVYEGPNFPVGAGGVAVNGHRGWWPFSKDRGVHRLPSSLASSNMRSVANNKQNRPSGLGILGSRWLATRRGRYFALACVLVAVVLAVVIAIVVIFGKRHHGAVLPSCNGNLTGHSCDLDATCVCTSTASGQCDQLAQVLFTLTPTVNELFNESLTTNDVSNAIWAFQGSPTGSNCAQQAMLVDVSPGLQESTSPNRTNWARAAILWNLVMSEDAQSTATLQKFVAEAPWSTLGNGSTDGKVEDPSGLFNKTVAGYTYDFAEQMITIPVVSYVDLGDPSSSETAEVDDVAANSLNRMYGYAAAASTQRQTALSNYWSSVLQQAPSDLSKFVSSVQQAPIFLPFDATSSPGGHAMQDLFSNSTTNAFPPPLACYPGLSSSQVANVAQLETTVYGLPEPASASSWNSSCYPDRPIYGVLDILRQRLPFADSRTGAARQAAVLNKNAYPRVILRAGEALAAFPGANDVPSITNSTLDPRHYGSTSYIEHVLLDYLISISDTNTANNVVEYVLSFPSVPPAASSPLSSALANLPIIEVAVFGSVTPQDISGAVSSFATPSDTLFFGDASSQVFRDWTLVGTKSYIQWTNSSTAPDVVHDSSLTDPAFLSVWTPAVQFFTTNSKENIGVSNVTAAFKDIGLYTQT